MPVKTTVSIFLEFVFKKSSAYRCRTLLRAAEFGILITGEAYCGDPGLYSVFGPRFWGCRRSMF